MNALYISIYKDHAAHRMTDLVRRYQWCYHPSMQVTLLGVTGSKMKEVSNKSRLEKRKQVVSYKAVLVDKKRMATEQTITQTLIQAVTETTHSSNNGALKGRQSSQKCKTTITT